MSRIAYNVKKVFQSLALKIGLLIIFIELVMFFSIGLYYVNHFSSRLEKGIENQIKVPGQLINQGVLTFEAVENEDILTEIVGEGVEEAIILGLNERVFYSLQQEYKGQKISEFKNAVFLKEFIDLRSRQMKMSYQEIQGDTHLHYLSPIFTLDGKTSRFFIYIKLNTSWIEAEKKRLIFSFTFSSGMAVVITSLLVIICFNIFIFSRLNKLSEATHSISKGDFDSILLDKTIVDSKDELGVLAKSFASMTEELQETTTSIDNLNDEIEIRIQTEKKLKKAEEKYRRQFEGAIDSIFVIDADTKEIIDCNPSATHMVGRELGNIIGFTLAQIFPENPHTEGIYSKQEAGKTYEFKMYDNYGELKFLSIKTSLIEIENKDVFQVVCRDITDVKKALEEKEMLTDKLNQSRNLEAIGTLAAGIAHEINTPIQYVGDNISFIQEETKNLFKLLEKQGEYIKENIEGTITREQLKKKVEQLNEEYDVDFIKEEFPNTFKQTLDGVKRVSVIVNAMKKFSHMGRDEKVQSDFNDLIESTIEVTRNEWKNVARIELALDPELPLVNCYPAEINQAAMNLIINATHAIAAMLGDNGGEGLINISTRQMGENVELVVRDNGCGIEPDVMEKVFDPFFTTKEIGKGTGQGLTIAYQTVVDKHGGKIEIDSSVGEGSTFRVLIPIL